MTEITDTKTLGHPLTLTPTQKRFILHWGEMGSKWGINRTVAQVHALLLVSKDPLNAEQITDALAVARSNVSTSIRELQGWGIVEVVHRLGDRRDYFHTMEDVWQMFRIVAAKRKQREIDPTAELLRELVESPGSKESDPYTHQRLNNLLTFIQTMTLWYQQVERLSPRAFSNMAKAGAKLSSMFERKPSKR